MSLRMKEIKSYQKIPNNWKEREKLRNKGQFWTPYWVAKAMVEYVIEDSKLLFDPATGRGAFCEALKGLHYTSQNIQFYGIDIDEKVLKEGLSEGIYSKEFCTLEVRDFIFNPPNRKFKSIVANPPYVRHHRLSLLTKNKLKELAYNILGFTIDGRAGLHVFFLIQALNLLEHNGKLAFIMPADTCEGIFAKDLWNWITNKFCLECIITFNTNATPFPNVDTNPIIFLIKNQNQGRKIFWVLSKQSHSDDLMYFVKSRFKKKNFPSLEIAERYLNEALNTGLSRPPQELSKFRYRLIDFARIMRGIATGANEFFFLTKNQAKELHIPMEYLKPAIGRTRDIEGFTIEKKHLEKLDKAGRPTLLFSPDARELDAFPEGVRNYLLYGEGLGINKRILIKTRKPWYKMEKRDIPEFLFTYLGRRNARFVKNNAGVLPLTGFLCVYPHHKNEDFIERLWKILKHPDTINNLRLVGKSYGAGAIKVEPRALENLPIPNYLVEKYMLNLKGKKIFDDIN